MTATWLAYGLAASALLALAALAAERAVRLWGRAGRWPWLAALYGSLAMAALPAILPARSPEAAPRWVAAALPVLSAPLPAPSSERPASLTRVTAGTRRVPAEEAIRGALLLPVSLAGLSLLVSWVRLRRRARGWPREVVDGAPVLVSETLGPAVIGFVRGTIVLPRWAFEADPAARALILAHEREHVRAGDHRLLALSLGAWVLMAWNPLAWWQLRRLRTAVELDCDGRVLRGGADARSYGALLLEISRYPSRAPALVTALGEPTSSLERRIRAMSRKRPRHRAPLTTAATLATVALVALACEMPRPALFDRSEREAQPIALSVVGTSAWRARPEFAKRLREVIEARHPRVYRRGQKGGEALWFVLDREDRIVDSWVGPRYTDERWKAFRGERRFPGLSLVPTLFDVPDRTGRPIFIVWAKPVRLWEMDGGPRPEIVQRIQAHLQATSLRLYGQGLPAGQAVWAVDHNAGKEENFLRDVEIWVGPLIADRKAQWETLRTHVPETVDVMPVNLQMRDFNGKPVPVVFGIETVW